MSVSLNDSIARAKRDEIKPKAAVELNINSDDIIKIGELKAKLNLTGLYKSSSSIKMYIEIYELNGRRSQIYASCDGYFFSIFSLEKEKDLPVYDRNGRSIASRSVKYKEMRHLVGYNASGTQGIWKIFEKISSLPEAPTSMVMSDGFKEVLGKGGISLKEMEEINSSLKTGARAGISVLTMILSFCAIIIGSIAQLDLYIQASFVATLVLGFISLINSPIPAGFVSYEASKIMS